MAARYYKYVTVTGTANVEATATLLSATPEEPKRVVELWVYESTGTRQNNAVLRVYIEREKIVELPIGVFLDWGSTPTYPQGAGRIPLDQPLEVGESLIVGHVSGGTASNITWAAVYEIAE